MMHGKDCSKLKYGLMEQSLYMSYFTSQNNLISERTVQRLRLETQSHPKPYELN
uniref:Uncharacterized protein n=2 Tax=Picea TaxID=3328 RepID=A0A101LX48_PICGL|nr:hypothetical protein ABT39_MTgene5988 [Picea glauca]QHR91469.1 hypothetical protein Q903MT_gene5503 [Picea sitchensis]